MSRSAKGPGGTGPSGIWGLVVQPRGAANLNTSAENCQEKLASLNVKKNYKFTEAQTTRVSFHGCYFGGFVIHAQAREAPLIRPQRKSLLGVPRRKAVQWQAVAAVPSGCFYESKFISCVY